jgi:hypothetical protein
MERQQSMGVMARWLAALVLVVAVVPARAQNCSILTGGNPCNAGCPDECSAILCPGNALCLSKCGGSGCNVGCSPGPCGSGCPDRCSPVLCPGNALCDGTCGGSGCNVGCSPGPCGSGCPDRCSPVLCPGNALCDGTCGGSGCNIGCSPGPCGSGCPDECSPILCPANALCREDCGGSSCNLTCNPGPCGAGCPDECSFLLCPDNPCSCSDAGEFCAVSANCCAGDQVCAFPQQVCAHDPRELGEPCGPLAPCRSGLRCGIELVCKEPSKVGEGCLIGSDCEDGLDCRACFVDGCPAPFTCFATANGPQLFGESDCLRYYSDAVQQRAIDSGLTLSFGYGSAVAAGVGGSYEVGTVYGQDGSYGCYLTTCVGGTVDVEIGSFVSVGFYTSFENFQGTSVAIVEEAGDGLSFSTSQVLGNTGALIGTADALSIEASLAPITAGVYDCDTTVNSFSIEPPSTTTTTSLPPGYTTTTVVTTTSTTVTSTTFPTIGIDQLLGMLGDALPNPDVAEGRYRGPARKLAKLFAKVQARLADADAATGRKCARLRRKASKGLRRMQRVAKRAERKDRLQVPAGTIDILAQGVRSRLPASCDVPTT